MSKKNQKTKTYILDLDTIVNVESRLLRYFQSQKDILQARELLIISIGAFLGMKIFDNLKFKYEDLINLMVGETFIRIEKKTGKERVLVI